MRKTIFILCLLIASCYFARGADVDGFYYWFDDDEESTGIYQELANNLLTVDMALDNVDKSSLPEGYHLFHMVAHYDDNTESEEITKYFLKLDPLPPPNEGNYIKVVEYWFADGVRNSETLAATENGDFNFTDLVSVAGLSPGTHYFNIRFMDDMGNWSAIQSNYFIIPDEPRWEDNSNVLINYEYWLDDQQFKVSGAIPNLPFFTLNTEIDSTGLTPGVHFVNVRFQDSKGDWSALQSNYFVKPDAPRWENPNNKITAYEYWLDDEQDKQSNYLLTEPDYTLETTIDTNGLAKGVHFVNVRFMDSEGNWSALQSNYFIIPDLEPFNKPDNIITKCEYWIDNGTRAVEPYTTGKSNTFTANYDASSLSPGVHYFNLRFLDKYGNWSALQSNYFIKPDFIWTNDNNKITAYQYWFVGPVGGIETTKGAVDEMVDPGENPFDLNAVYGVPSYDIGGVCSFNIQFQDAEGLWSPVYSSTFTFVNAPPVVVMGSYDAEMYDDETQVLTASVTDANGDDMTYEWRVTTESDPTGVVISTALNATFNPSVAGDYIITFSADDGRDVSSESISVHVISNQPPVANCQNVTVSAGADCMAEASIDDGSYDPDEGEGDVIVLTQTPPGPYDLGTTEVTLTVTDSYGETDQCTATVTVIDDTKPVISTISGVTKSLSNSSVSFGISDVVSGVTDNCTQDITATFKQGTVTTYSCSDAGTQKILTVVATDAAGNSTEANVTVTIGGEMISSVEIDVDPEYPLSGEGRHTIYLGVGEQSVTLTATPDNNAGNSFTYSWKLGTSEVSTSQSYEFSPSAQGTYNFTVTVTNEYGCSYSSATPVSIYVYDWRCGNNNDKVKVCHNGREICVAQSAVQAHLDHGDYLGDCTDDKRGDHDHDEELYTTTEGSDITLILKQNSPNPFSHLTEIQYFVSKSEHISLILTDIDGREIAKLAEGTVTKGWNTVMYNGSNLASGTYILRLESQGNSVTTKIVKTE